LFGTHDLSFFLLFEATGLSVCVRLFDESENPHTAGKSNVFLAGTHVAFGSQLLDFFPFFFGQGRARLVARNN
jgi:hypothetical protein